MLFISIFLNTIYLLNTLCLLNSLLLPLEVRNIKFLKENRITKEISELMYLQYNKAVILNGDKTLLKRDYCKLLCDMNNFNFVEYNFREFLDETPYNDNHRTMFYINDFLIDNGRIINFEDENKLLNIPETSNLLILQSDNLEKIPIKDINLIRKFKILEFPKVEKKEIVNYIYSIIDYYNYSEDLYIINWNKHKNLEDLNLEKLNILLFEIDSMIKEKVDIVIINNSIDYLINSLNFL